MSLKFLVGEKSNSTFSHQTSMRSSDSDVQKRENLQERLIQQIVKGNYPSKDVSKMNVNALENFVLRLLKFTSVKVSAKSKGDPELTNLWSRPSDVLVNKSAGKDRKEFRGNLKKVVIHCCEFFKVYNQKWLPPAQSWVNDENFDYIHANSGKRKSKEPLEVPPTKKRKTLLLSVKKELTSEPFISIQYIPDDIKPLKCFSQPEFLQIFQLTLNNNEIPRTTQVPNSSRIIRLQNCPHVPFSSDVGQVLVKRENCSVPDQVTQRKIERIEWYINKDPPKTIPNLKYEVTYEENDKKKNYTEHQFRFPKKQYYQVLGDRHFNSFVRKICKPLKVTVKNDNLLELKNKMDRFKEAKVKRAPSNRIKKQVYQEARVLLENKIKQPKVVLVNEKISKATNMKFLKNNRSKNIKTLKNKSILRNPKRTRSAARHR